MALAPDSTSPLPPDTLIGPWRLLKHLNSGAFGRVYKAVLAHPPDSPTYALKLARRPADPRFEREATLLSRLHHPGVPKLQASGTFVDERGRPFPYLVMEFIPGEDLYDWPLRHRLTTRALLLLMAQVTRALEATHLHGVHRDIKGDNIRVRRDGRVALLDFGACWYPDARPITDAPIPPGTEPYRSPQIVRFRHQHPRDRGARYRFVPEDDLFALGVTGYYLATGCFPAPVTDPGWPGDARRFPPERRLPPSALVTILPEADALIWRLMSQEPSKRGRAREVAEELEKTAASLGPEADERIVPTPFYKTTERLSEPGPPLSRSERRWRWARRALVPPLASLGVALALIGLVALLSAILSPMGGEATGDSGRVDVGSAALSASAEEGPRGSTRTVSGNLPSEPFKGQKQPPCDSSRESEINRGCWVHSPLPPPCPRQWYEWKDSCYLPVMTLAERMPTSEDP